MSAIQARALREGRSIKDEVNYCLERALGLGSRTTEPWEAKTYAMGGATADLGKAWELVDRLEEEAYTAKRELRK